MTCRAARGGSLDAAKFLLEEADVDPRATVRNSGGAGASQWRAAPAAQGAAVVISSAPVVGAGVSKGADKTATAPPRGQLDTPPAPPAAPNALALAEDSLNVMLSSAEVPGGTYSGAWHPWLFVFP